MECVKIDKSPYYKDFHDIVYGVMGILGGVMSENKKVKFTVYLDEEILNQADKAVEDSGCKSRNEFIIKAIENYIAEQTLVNANPILTNKIAELISKSNDVAMKKVASGLFRYAVFLDMTIQMIADCIDIDDVVLEEYRKRAYNNVRRTRGRISLDSTLYHTGIREEE